MKERDIIVSYMSVVWYCWKYFTQQAGFCGPRTVELVLGSSLCDSVFYVVLPVLSEVRLLKEALVVRRFALTAVKLQLNGHSIS